MTLSKQEESLNDLGIVEIVSYKDLAARVDTLARAKATGKLRLEGKNHVIQDGDIVSFCFKV